MRLSPKLRERTKQYASAIIRLYVALPFLERKCKFSVVNCCDDCGITAKELVDLLTEINELMPIFVTMVNRTKRRRT